MFDLTKNIASFFNETGKYCADILQGSLDLFTSFVGTSLKFLTMGVDSDEFSSLWTVIKNITSVINVIATTLMVLLFLVNICTDTWQSRHEADFWTQIKQIMKMIVAVILVNNSLVIVTSIFNLGANLAFILINRQLPGGSSDATAAFKYQLPENVKNTIETGVSGFRGLIVFLLFVGAALIVITSGVKIILEIYQRVFKIFVLIPFSTISFTTFVMGDGNRGDEVFKGYLKSIISTALEAVIIVMCVMFCSSLLTDQTTMNAMFDANLATDVAIQADNEDELNALIYYSSSGGTNNALIEEQLLARMGITIPTINDDKRIVMQTVQGRSGKIVSNSTKQSWEEKYSLSQKKTAADKLSKNPLKGTFSFVKDPVGSMQDMGSITTARLDIYDLSSRVDTNAIVYPCVCVWFVDLGWKEILMLLLSVVFPIVLCAGAVKQSSTYANLIMGK